MDTLILNKDGSPLSILPLSAVRWQEAIKYIWMDRVTVLDWYDDWVVSSPSWETRVPAVIMVKTTSKRTEIPDWVNLMWDSETDFVVNIVLIN